LATGLVVQFIQYAMARRPAGNAFLARSLAFLAAAVVLVSVAGLAFGVPRTVPSGTRESVAQSKAPNVLLVVLDTLRADHLSSYGYARPTTLNLDRLAQQGVLFEKAYATAAWTLPSHATLFTGRYGYEHRAGVKPLDTRYPTLAEALYLQGYATAGFSANSYYVTPATGLKRGFEHFAVYYHSVTDMVARTFYGDFLLDRLPLLGYYDRPGRKRAAEVNREFLSWVGKKQDAPFFAFLNYFEVHDPYLAPPPYQTRFTDQPTRGNRINTVLYPHDFTGGRPFSPQEIQAEIDGYDASLVYLDAELGNLFDRLAALGVLDNTVVIITSDHGEAFSTHGLFGHGNSMYRELLHVPLIIRYPRALPGGLQVPDVVSLQALPATVMDLIGRGAEQPFPGRSWATCWAQGRSDEPCAGDFSFSDASPSTVPESKFGSRRRVGQRSVSTAEWHLILYAEGDAELYRVRDDPQELNNLAGTPEGQQVVMELMARMDETLPSGD
ncbi:MAG: sulfatase, partial [Anaerolineae bacterium]|nr:sulfatase [Anaerolineae bacterium]